MGLFLQPGVILLPVIVVAPVVVWMVPTTYYVPPETPKRQPIGFVASGRNA